MNQIFLLLGFIAAACASGLQTGYNYESSAPQEVQYSQPQVRQSAQNSDVHKEFYYFNAPAEEHVQNHKVITHTIQTQPKRTQRVISINLPQQTVQRRTTQHITQNVVDDKTHIYVLNKEPRHTTAPQHTQFVQQATVHHHKPEVHFLKYRTPEEAEQIQQSIIQQYGGKPSDLIHLGSGTSVSFGTNTRTNVHRQSPQGVSREYLAPEPAATQSVDNNYAKNFLPSGPDVVPGSSYLPPALRY